MFSLQAAYILRGDPGSVYNIARVLCQDYNLTYGLSLRGLPFDLLNKPSLYDHLDCRADIKVHGIVRGEIALSYHAFVEIPVLLPNGHKAVYYSWPNPGLEDSAIGKLIVALAICASKHSAVVKMGPKLEALLARHAQEYGLQFAKPTIVPSSPT